MTLMIQPDPEWSTNHLLGVILAHCQQGERVQFLVEPRAADKVVQRLRVALSRSRNRNSAHGKKLHKFTLRHSTYAHTDRGVHKSAIVMWIEKTKQHKASELLDDLMERN